MNISIAAFTFIVYKTILNNIPTQMTANKRTSILLKELISVFVDAQTKRTIFSFCKCATEKNGNGDYYVILLNYNFLSGITKF